MYKMYKYKKVIVLQLYCVESSCPDHAVIFFLFLKLINLYRLILRRK